MQRLVRIALVCSALAGCGAVPFIPTSQPGLPVTRADLAAAYLRFDGIYAARTPGAAEDVVRVNREFDRATFAFFSGDFARTIEAINRVGNRLQWGAAPSAAQQLAAALKVRVEPPVFVRGSGGRPLARLGSMYAVDTGDKTDVSLVLRARNRQGVVAFELPFQVAGGAAARTDQSLALPGAAVDLPVGSYDLDIVSADGAATFVTRWFVSAGSLDATRRANIARLGAIRVDVPALRSALSAVKARNDLLTDRPSDEKSSQFLAHLPELAAEIDAEATALENGRDPFARRVGDYRAAVRMLLFELPFRVYAPPAAAERRLPLVIALHGAGGDENMFMDGYGGGALRRLADERGFLVVSPLTYTISTNQGFFEKLLEFMKSHYDVDDSRIYVMGHSLGAGAAASLAGTRSDHIAAAVCLAGGRGFPVGGAPTLVFAAALDPIVPAAALRRGVEQAAANGAAVEFRELADYGHTLMVGPALPASLDFLLSRAKRGRPNAVRTPLRAPQRVKKAE